MEMNWIMCLISTEINGKQILCWNKNLSALMKSGDTLVEQHSRGVGKDLGLLGSTGGTELSYQVTCKGIQIISVSFSIIGSPSTH